ncbi:MAG: DNA double-strand break repair nuclease NurA, partial [Ktedonobacterales bacterium]|nr:DNA double-strand break repair nuclease NurA [Ktedonobacterales bacterium]
LVGMLRAAFPERALPPTKRVHDGLLWGDHLAWGDATVPWISARGDVLAEYGAQRGGIAFAYLQAATDRPPARIEMPRWVAESDLFPHVLDVLRAELVAGNGYPYAIETADAVAVIGVEDRARFYALFQRFAAEAGLPLTFSRKSVSKSRRR